MNPSKNTKNPLETVASTLSLSEKLLGRSGFLLAKAAQRVRDAYDSSLAETGMNARHAGVMAILGEKGTISQSEIGSCTYIDRTTVVAVIDDLEKLGYVERKEHPTDRRSHAIYLTEKGKEYLPKIDKQAMETEGKFLECLNTQEQKNLIQLLRKLVLNHYTVTKETR
jgi:DNA-binding MarR family transcriptional regulator